MVLQADGNHSDRALDPVDYAVCFGGDRGLFPSVHSAHSLPFIFDEVPGILHWSLHPQATLLSTHWTALHRVAAVGGSSVGGTVFGAVCLALFRSL